MSNIIAKNYAKFIRCKGYIPKMFNPYNCSEVTDIAPTQTTNCGHATTSATVLIADAEGKEKNMKYRIRKLTPNECWRLMGFSDEAFEKAEAVNSNSQLYKEAGNSIVVDCLVHILKNLKLE